MLFDRHTLDLRLPRTREMDKAGNDAILYIKRNLDMASLLCDRREAITKRSEGPWPSRVIVSPQQRLQRETYNTRHLLLTMTLWRDVYYKIDWKVQFKICGQDILSPRQLLRIQRAVVLFVQEQPHLTNLVITPSRAEIQINTTAQIGNFAEPM